MTMIEPEQQIDNDATTTTSFIINSKLWTDFDVIITRKYGFNRQKKDKKVTKTSKIADLIAAFCEHNKKYLDSNYQNK